MHSSMCKQVDGEERCNLYTTIHEVGLMCNMQLMSGPVQSNSVVLWPAGSNCSVLSVSQYCSSVKRLRFFNYIFQ